MNDRKEILHRGCGGHRGHGEEERQSKLER
jgi:hypothetical protein